LSAADLHLVVMGDPFVGLVHPCKAYNLLRVNAPIFYMGPKPSHISEMLAEINGQILSGWAPHGQPAQAVQTILDLKQTLAGVAQRDLEPKDGRFSKENLLPRMVDVIESAGSRP
jgi:hypothetical protein